MTRTLFEIWILILGIILGFFIFILSEPNKHTEVAITTIGEITEFNFKSDRLKDGDTFVIIKDRDTILTGIVVDGVWK